MPFDQKTRFPTSPPAQPKPLSRDQGPPSSALSFRLATTVGDGPSAQEAFAGQRLEYFAPRRTSARAAPTPRASQTVIWNTLRQEGEPLDSSTRNLMERPLGVDLGHIRVHTDADAAASARDLDAEAYTVERHIAFGEGAFAPRTTAGRALLAHELAHAAHQRGDPGSGPFVVGDRHGTAEKAADTIADAVTCGFAPGSAGLAELERAGGPPPQQRSGAGGRDLTIHRKAKEPGKEIWKERADPDEEQQRVEAFAVVGNNAALIREQAAKFNVDAIAIAAAILWEAIENPYHRPIGRLGPGKIHPSEFLRKSEAEKVEEEGRLPASKDVEERTRRLQQATWAIKYIAAIMRRHADNYWNIGGVDISHNVGVLCTLYQGGNSEERARRLAEKRKVDPNAQPQPGDEMGPWAEKNKETIQGWTELGLARPFGK